MRLEDVYLLSSAKRTSPSDCIKGVFDLKAQTLYAEYRRAHPELPASETRYRFVSEADRVKFTKQVVSQATSQIDTNFKAVGAEYGKFYQEMNPKGTSEQRKKAEEAFLTLWHSTARPATSTVLKDETDSFLRRCSLKEADVEDRPGYGLR